MKPEAQRIAILEASGWTECRRCWHPMDVEGRQGLQWLGIAPINKGKPFETACWKLPDPPNDLNAMHEAEEQLFGKKWHIYTGHLSHICSGYSSAYHATAAQRAEAFLKTLGLWK